MPDSGTPVIDRTPPYLQIVNWLRGVIEAGELDGQPVGPGSQLPTVPELMTRFGVARATVSRALGQLAVEGAVRTTTQGTFVSGNDAITRPPSARLTSRRLGLGETAETGEAGIVPAPDYVADLLGLAPGAMVVRRQEITSRRGRPVMLSVDWIPVSNHLLAAELVAAAPVPGGLLRKIESITRRTANYADDKLRGREADRREAAALGIQPGEPLLAGASLLGDDEGAILYTEWCIRPDVTVTYTLRVDPEEAAGDLGAQPA